MGLNATSPASSNVAFPLGNQSVDATKDSSNIEDKKSPDKSTQDQSPAVEMGNKGDVFTASGKSSKDDTSTEKSDTSDKKPKEMPWYLSLGKSLVVMTASGLGLLAGLRYGFKGAAAGYMAAGAATGGAINALYQKCTSDKFDKNQFFKNVLIGAAGF
jgi:hypothetical protein